MAVRVQRRTAVIIGVMILAALWLAVRPSGAQEQREQREQRKPAAKQHADPHVMTVHPGDDVTLPCEAGDVSIRTVEWTRADLESGYVLLNIDGHSDPTFQHPSFTDRVELVDRELKDGDVSLILKNVNSRDSGTYECRVKPGGSRRTKKAIIKTDPISIIYLEVTDLKTENSMDGNSPPLYVGLAAGFGVGTVFLLAAALFVVVWIFKKRPELFAALKTSVDQLV